MFFAFPHLGVETKNTAVGGGRILASKKETVLCSAWGVTGFAWHEPCKSTYRFAAEEAGKKKKEPSHDDLTRCRYGLQ